MDSGKLLLNGVPLVLKNYVLPDLSKMGQTASPSSHVSVKGHSIVFAVVKH